MERWLSFVGPKNNLKKKGHYSNLRRKDDLKDL